MLGKGLESLIPPKPNNNGENNEPELKAEPIFSSVKPNQEEVHDSGVLFSNPKPFPRDLNFPPIEKKEEPKEVEKEQEIIPEIKNDLPVLKIASDLAYEASEREIANKKPEAIFQIEVERIVPNPHQPRRYFDETALRDLANSIREFGVIQPLTVSKISEETENGTRVYYELIAGERRLMASKMAGLRTVPAIVKQVSVEREKLELAIIENIQRADLNPIEEARAYSRLQDEFRMTQREIASRLGKSRETVANAMRLLNLPSEIQTALESGQINESQARLLLQIDDIARQRDVFYAILTDKLSVRDLKERINRSAPGIKIERKIDPTLEAIKSRLEELLGTKVEIKSEGDKGKITINFYSSEELSSLIDKLVKQNDNQSL